MSASQATLPHVLGSKVVGEARASAAMQEVLRPALGPLARGTADRFGNPLVAVDDSPLARGPRVTSTTVDDVDDVDVDELNGWSPAAPLPIVERDVAPPVPIVPAVKHASEPAPLERTPLPDVIDDVPKAPPKVDDDVPKPSPTPDPMPKPLTGIHRNTRGVR